MSTFPPRTPRPADASEATGRPHLDFSKLKQVRPRDVVVRFLFGGAVSVLAALLGHWVTPRFGGLFTAFPAILLASLTLLSRKEGEERASDDAKGSVVGAVALIACASLLVMLLSWLAGALALSVALVLWLLLASLIYGLLLKIGWREPEPRQHQEDQEQ